MFTGHIVKKIEKKTFIKEKVRKRPKLRSLLHGGGYWNFDVLWRERHRNWTNWTGGGESKISRSDRTLFIGDLYTSPYVSQISSTKRRRRFFLDRHFRLIFWWWQIDKYFAAEYESSIIDKVDFIFLLVFVLFIYE